MTQVSDYESQATRRHIKLTAAADDVSAPAKMIEGRFEFSAGAVTVFPGAGGTAALQITTVKETELDDDAVWVNWSNGEVAEATGAPLPIALTAVRLKATTAAAEADIILVLN